MPMQSVSCSECEMNDVGTVETVGNYSESILWSAILFYCIGKQIGRHEIT